MYEWKWCDSEILNLSHNVETMIACLEYIVRAIIKERDVVVSL